MRVTGSATGETSRRRPASGLTVASDVAQNLTSAQQGPSSYGALAGTSMACPSAAGMTGLIRQYCTEGWYPTGTKITSADYNTIPLTPHQWHGEWNYTLLPLRQRS